MKKIGTHKNTGKPAFGAMALSLIAASLVGCGDQVAGSPAAAEVDVQQLTVGNYPTDPLDVRFSYSHAFASGESIRAIALARLTDHVVIGADVDPRFSHNVLALSLDSAKAAKLTKVLGGAVQPALENNGMMFGFSAAASSRALPKSRQRDRSGNFSPFDGAEGESETSAFNVTVLQFPDQQRAQAAADQMEAADFAVAADQNVHVTLDKQPNAKAHWRPGVPSMAATMSYGQYVVNVYVAQPKPNLDELRKLAEQVFTAQLPLLDQAPALSPHEIFRLDYDPDAMQQRTLHPNEYIRPHPISEATRTPRGYLHYVDDQATWKRLLEDSGVDRMSTASSGGMLFRARDAAAANALWSGINSATRVSVAAPAKVPNVSCTSVPKDDFDQSWYAYDLTSTGTVYICALHYDRYVARVASGQLTDVQQRAAAQYALLAKAQYM
ncbi:hypothetical protein ACFXPR_07445 [Nocardia tengchongensis]|uniref:DUF7373 family lipoprotein n=1 Tax=Nocardia tengchongensis TaxID=2055889 RepID=UPI003695190E